MKYRVDSCRNKSDMNNMCGFGAACKDLRYIDRVSFYNNSKSLIKTEAPEANTGKG
ncbi:MAG: hypothetical protein LWY06_15315 [Firmicutes bacterium]|nr:hypothetical protein [Bacillota bacterium]